MSKQNIIRITVFFSIFIFNPAIADTLRIASTIQRNTATGIKEDIASALQQKGIEAEVAGKRTDELLNDTSELFAQMLGNLLHQCGEINRDEMLEYLGHAALHREYVALDSYPHLINIYSKIRGSSPDKGTRQKLHSIAERNALMMG